MAINFPDSPSSGDTFTDSTSGFTYEWNGTVWRSFDPSTAANIRELDDISSGFNGSLKAFNLTIDSSAIEPANAQQLIIAVNGSLMNPVNDYTISGSVITFTTAPTGGHAFVGTLLGSALSLNTIADNTVGPTALTTTSNFRMNGLTLDQGAGIITAFGFQGGSITADLDSTFSANVSIAGSLTVQGTQTIINTDELNVQDKTIGIGSTNAPTSTTQDDAGVIIYGQTHVNILYDRDKAAVGINTGLSLTGFVTATGGVNIDADNAKLELGAASDLQVYHNATNSLIENSTGNLIIQNDSSSTSEEILLQPKSGEQGIKLVANGQCEIYHDGSLRFYTTSSGTEISGALIATAATVGSGVTINNTGIDAGIGAGIVTASSFVGGGANITALSGSNIASGTVAAARVATLNQDTTGNADTATTATNSTNSSHVLVTDNESTNEDNKITFVENATSTTGNVGLEMDGNLYYNPSTGKLTATQLAGTLQTAAQTNITSLGSLSALTVTGDVDIADKIVHTGDTNTAIRFPAADTISAETSGSERLKITSTGGFQFSNGLFDEKVKITAGKLSDNTTIDLENGMVHYFTTQESTTSTPNIRINGSTTLQSAMDTGDVCTVTLITTAAAGGYSADLNIDGNGVTEEWVGGAAPAAGSADGLDIYCYTIICIGTGTGDSGFKVIANLTNATN